MKSHDEIKKGLEYLSITNVAQKVEAAKKGLPYAYTEEVAADALELIQQLEAELKDEKNNHQHTIDVAERMKAQIEKLKAVVIKLNSERNEAVIKNQKLEEEKDDMLETIKRMVICGADCGGCVHFVEEPDKNCVELDFECEKCQDKCACYSCKDGSNYEWKGMAKKD